MVFRKLPVIAVSLTSLLSSPTTCHAIDYDTAAKAVVFLRHEYTETYSDPGGTYEIWLKLPSTNLFRPKTAFKCGTGFLTGIGDHQYLITAKHIATNMTLSAADTVTHASPDGTPASLPLLTIRGALTNGWIHHGTADVSVLPIALPPQLAPQFQKQFMDLGTFFARTTNPPSRNISLTIVGFPWGIGWGHEPGAQFSPLTRKTRASSTFLEQGTLFLLEDPSVEGYSGAPVFDLGEPLLSAEVGLQVGGRDTGGYGLISYTRSDNTGGKMAGVVPTHCFLDLVREYEATLAPNPALPPHSHP